MYVEMQDVFICTLQYLSDYSWELKVRTVLEQFSTVKTN